MASSLDSHTLNLVFSSQPDILARISKAADSPTTIALFNDIAAFVLQRIQDDSADEPASKRRRIGGSAPSADIKNGAVDVSAEPVLLEVQEISVSIPQRKKFELCFTADHLYARTPGTSGPANGIVYAWRDIAHVFFLPVPEKTTVQYNYIIIPRNSCVPASKNAPPGDDPLVFTVSGAPPKQGTIQGPEAAKAAAISDSYQTLLDWAISSHLRAVGSTTSIVASDPNVFQSASKQVTRPGERPVHVKAYRGPKDGYMFFLPTGILWGFKKPLLFIPLERMVAVSYTNVLQRTFNMVVEVFLLPGEGESDDATEEIEFAMLDPIDHGGIDQNYVRRHNLQDRSMAEQRKASLQLAENIRAAKKQEEDKEAGNGDGQVAVAAEATGEFAGMSELQIAEIEAERQLQDAEDEEEEDYVPESGDDSYGSGSSSEEDSDGDGGDEEEEEEEEEDEKEPEPAPPPKTKPAQKAQPAQPAARTQPVVAKEQQVRTQPVAVQPAPPPPVEEDQVMATEFDDDEDEILDVGA